MSIHEMTASEMRERLERREPSSVEVVKALHERADQVEERVNGFAHQFREQALREARRSDEERARGEVRGPLHGLPLSVKENIDTQGTASTLGLRSRLAKPADHDAVVVRVAREAGAIVIGKSNLPQALLPMNCTNALFGTTRNPWSSEHVAGGSSGGEAALLASGEKPVARLWQLAAERNALQVAENQMWQAAGIQALVCPAAASPAVPFDMA